MSLDQLRKEIRLEAQKQRKAALKEAEDQASRIISEAEAAAKELVDEARKKAGVEALQKQTQVSASRLEAKKMVADARDALVAEQLDGVFESLKKFADSAAYDAVLKKLAAQASAALGAKGRILARKKDSARLKKLGYSDVEEFDCMGGCIAATTDGRIRINHTFEALYEENLEQLRQRIFEEL